MAASLAGVSKCSSERSGRKRKIEEIEGTENNNNGKSIKKFFTSKKSDPKPDECKPHSKWKWKGTLLFYESELVQPSDKIAAFDFDGTLAKTSLFKHGVDAWSVLYSNCLNKLTELHDKGYKLVIFTNQAGIGRAKASKEKTIAEKTGRLEAFVKKANLPFQVFASTTKDNYYKPGTGMWQHMTTHCNGDQNVDMQNSFFVGDAAGRKKDHSSSDKDFAKNCGLQFYTDAEFFKS